MDTIDYVYYMSNNYLLVDRFCGTKMNKYKHFNLYNIPFEINNTDVFVKWLMKIAEAKPLIDEYYGSPLEIQLLRKAKVRAITYSSQIEGNKLNESEVTAILNNQRVAGSPKDIKEIQNYQLALDYVEKLAKEPRKINQDNFCDIQKLLTSKLLPESQAGSIRKVPVSIVNSITREVIQECPPPDAMQGLLDDFWQWVDRSDGINSFARAFAIHFLVVAIHPFVDGNGRTARLMQHLFLLKDKELIAKFVPSETAIMANRSKYYSVLGQARILQSLHPILEFLAECFATSAHNVVLESKSIIKEASDKTPKIRRQKIINYAKKHNLFSISGIIPLFPCITSKTISRDLEHLVSENILKAIGEKKGRKYSIIKSRALN